MKISKKIVSLLLCMAMLAAMIPTVFASGSTITVTANNQTNNLTVYSDQFNVSGSDSTGVTLSNASAKQVQGDNYALNFVSDAATVSSYNKKFTNPYADVSGGQYSISYDMYINSISSTKSSDNFLNITGTTYRINGTRSWLISHQPFTYSSNHSDYIVAKGTDKRIYTQRWYHIEHYFDVVAGYTYDFVTDDEGNCFVHNNTNGYDVAKIEEFTIATYANGSSDILFDNITITNESIKISSMPESVEASESFSFNVTLPEGFESAVILADGEILGNISPVSGKNSYDVTVPAGALAVGNREIIVSASYSNGKAISASKSVLINKTTDKGITLQNSTLTTDVEDFNSLGSVAAFNDGGTLDGSTFYDDYLDNWMTANGTKSISRVTGASEESNDYALCITDTGTDPLLQLSLGNKGVRMAEEGQFVIEFDLNITDGTTIQIDQVIPFWAASGNFIISGNKVNVAQNVLNPGSWYSFKMILDIDEAKWYCYLGDDLIINGNKAVTLVNGVSTEVAVGDVKFDNIRFYCRGGSFAIDNLKVYNTVEDATVTSASYDSTVITNKAIPATAKTLNLTLSDTTLAPTIDDVELCVDGTEVNATAVSTTEGVVAITLPALKANTDLDVVIKSTVDGLENDVTETFYVTDASGYFFKSAGIVKSGAKLISTVRHFGNTGFTPVVASYASNELTSVATARFDYTNSHGNHAKLFGHSAYNMVLTPSSADSAKVMAWNDLTSATPKMTAASYTLN